MTSPDGAVPAKAMTATELYEMANADPAALGAAANGDINASLQEMQGNLLGGMLSMIARAITGGLFSNFLSPSVQGYTAAQYATMNDHTRQITELIAAFDQLTLQGNAIVFSSNNTYYPSPGIISVDTILIGAGAGGGSGRWDVIPTNRGGGGGGGGGGEVHVSVPANLLPKNPDGSYAGIPIFVGQGGQGASQPESVGGGGGDTGFSGFLTAGGGIGGGYFASATNIARGGPGGTGMIRGGGGGIGAGVLATSTVSTPGGDSTSPYDLHGGGGGGGGGAGFNGGASSGGAGGISKGGLWGRPGEEPSSLVTTGGGGGGGAGQNGGGNGTGGYPGGGGGGGGGSGGSGGVFAFHGAAGRAYVIERFV